MVQRTSSAGRPTWYNISTRLFDSTRDTTTNRLSSSTAKRHVEKERRHDGQIARQVDFKLISSCNKGRSNPLHCQLWHVHRKLQHGMQKPCCIANCDTCAASCNTIYRQPQRCAGCTKRGSTICNTRYSEYHKLQHNSPVATKMRRMRKWCK